MTSSAGLKWKQTQSIKSRWCVGTVGRLFCLPMRLARIVGGSPGPLTVGICFSTDGCDDIFACCETVHVGSKLSWRLYLCFKGGALASRPSILLLGTPPEAMKAYLHSMLGDLIFQQAEATIH